MAHPFRKFEHTDATPTHPSAKLFKPRRNFEHQYAVALNIWWREYARYSKLDERLFFAIPNGGHRRIGAARKLKAEGTRPGIPDYFLAIPKAGFPGLWLELKEEGGSLSKDQREVIGLFQQQGYRCVVAYSVREATDEIERYLTSASTNPEMRVVNP